MHQRIVPFCLLLSIAFMGCSGGSTKRLVDHDDEYHILKDDPHDRVWAPRNEHPPQPSMYSIHCLLSDCRYTYRLYDEWGRPRRVFTREQVDELAPVIWEGFQTAKPFETIEFSTSTVDFGIVRDDGDVTSGWIWKAGGRWHIGFDTIYGHPFKGQPDRPRADGGEDPFVWEMWPLHYRDQRYHVDRDGHEQRNALEIAHLYPGAGIDDLPDWRSEIPWEGFEMQEPRSWNPSRRDWTDRYWDREKPSGEE
ncbi:MAG: hypothetical protein HY720_18110 [Planctomycetes bacterium]|nr:hypothetical protein [Planctomycetota bacterium]